MYLNRKQILRQKFYNTKNTINAFLFSVTSNIIDDSLIIITINYDYWLIKLMISYNQWITTNNEI